MQREINSLRFELQRMQAQYVAHDTQNKERTRCRETSLRATS
jgi:hypothetical protein